MLHARTQKKQHAAATTSRVVLGAGAVSASSAIWSAIENAVSLVRRHPFRIRTHHALDGGCINAAALVEGDGERFFVKLNDAGHAGMFAAEAEGLRELAAAAAVRVPGVIGQGEAAGQTFLVLEYLELGPADGGAHERLGRELAALHRHQASCFGWTRDNTIGSTPQINAQESDWIVFFREHRLRHQFELAVRNGYRAPLGDSAEELLEVLPKFFSAYRPAASLLHGDLWGGNHGALADGTPVIFDPAVYYGDREADLAMTELFGGFSGRFYAAYREAWPLDPGYAVRKTLYNLYHILNHLNLFGGGYSTQARSMIARLLAEAR